MITEDRVFEPAANLLAVAVEEREVPGAVALVRRHGDIVMHEAFGAAMLEPEYRPMALDTIFDLASLTKPLAATPVILSLVEDDLLALDAPVVTYLPELRGSAVAGSTIQQLLTHTSGLRDWYPVYAHARTPEDSLRTIAGLELAYQPGTRVEYSCLGFIVLGILAQRVTSTPLDQLADDIVFRPLGLTEIGYRPRYAPERFAATERGNDYERGTAANAKQQFGDWRSDYVPGAVHDGNAYYAMGGVSGNAGLFGTASDIGIVGQMWLNGGEYNGVRILSPAMVELAITDLTPGLESARGLGWVINRPPAPGAGGHRSSGSLLSPRTFGHTGFTGTSLWIDPENDLVVVLLTNRIHPRVDEDMTVIKLRHRFHDAVAIAVQGATRSR